MKRARAAVGTLVFLVLAPGVVAGVVPWLITRWSVNEWAVPLRVAGAVMIVGGALVLLQAFGRFVVEGIGTPAPVAPTEHLVVGGAYRYVRNPMYLAVLSLIVGQALVLGQASLFLYAAVIGVMVVSFVHAYEEPTLADRYGEQYDAYRRAVPGWRPRLTRWRG